MSPLLTVFLVSYLWIYRILEIRMSSDDFNVSCKLINEWHLIKLDMSKFIYVLLKDKYYVVRENWTILHLKNVPEKECLGDSFLKKNAGGYQSFTRGWRQALQISFRRLGKVPGGHLLQDKWFVWHLKDFLCRQERLFQESRVSLARVTDFVHHGVVPEFCSCVEICNNS